ncbi:unnamed protein product [Trichogramma brassicae]|uniref:Uncharacterized protein n=1 Tax=Trichogramma brassicae TaxID=86971 RepID=A0A6H5J4P4_9HYME|nr:unnamed protein product [Trichogramma brassicae]
MWTTKRPRIYVRAFLWRLCSSRACGESASSSSLEEDGLMVPVRLYNVRASPSMDILTWGARVSTKRIVRSRTRAALLPLKVGKSPVLRQPPHRGERASRAGWTARGLVSLHPHSVDHALKSPAITRASAAGLPRRDVWQGGRKIPSQRVLVERRTLKKENLPIPRAHAK